MTTKSKGAKERVKEDTRSLCNSGSERYAVADALLVAVFSWVVAYKKHTHTVQTICEIRKIKRRKGCRLLMLSVSLSLMSLNVLVASPADGSR